MGDVWRAVDRSDGSVVAAKLLRPELTRDPDIVARFIQERSILLALQHPNIVPVRDLVVEGEALAIVMDLVEGADLRTRLREKGTFAPGLAVGVACAVLEALAAAHGAGALHRDVKPDNVLVAGGEDFGPDDVWLSDFSIARLAQESTVMATGLLGTPGYMPPELFVNGTFSAASDVYAVGVLLYELLAGRTPFAGPGTAHTVGHRHVTAAPPRLPVHDELWRALATMLAKDPGLRLPPARTAEQLRALPDELGSAPALPVQPEPAAWHQADGVVARGPISVREVPADVDIGETFVPGQSPTDVPVARHGEVRALAPATLTGTEETQLGRVGPPVARPTLQAQVDAPEPVQRRSWKAWAGAAAGVALLGVAGWVVIGFLGGDDEVSAEGTGAGTRLQATMLEDPLPTGLSVTRQVTYDPETKTAELSIRYGAQAAPLRGPFLEVIPPAGAGDQCPLVAWEDADVSPNIPQVSGIAVPCGYAVEPPVVPAQGAVEVHARVMVELPADPQALDSWLASVSASTSQALDSQPAGAAYPGQRLEDVEVEVPVDVRVGSGALRVRLLPVWRGAERPDDLRVLHDSKAVGEPSELLEQVAGGLEGVWLSDGCDGALVIVNSRRVGVLRASESCTVRAQVGNFTDLVSTTFRIAPAGG